ncbi:MAG TPA: hypothetical protein VMR41_05530 [Patescibacteria group bacterium]|nr:hypothetical protein [Patescibacteria group bacterium]
MKQILMQTSFLPQAFSFQHFSLLLYPSVYEIRMTMKMLSPVFNTCEIPGTYSILRQNLPSIFTSKCFNDNQYSFKKEVKNTEIGHLFEHILLEYLCIEKIKMGYEDAVFNGVTNWNWIEDPKGTFHITVDAGWQEKELFMAAFEKSITLLNMILNSLI